MLGSSKEHMFQAWWTMAIAVVVLGAFALYLFQLDDQSLWRDEGLSVVRSQQPLGLTLANKNVVQGVESADLHPPLYFLLLHGWRLVAGDSEFALRFPSVAAMVVALALLATLGRRIWGREAGLWTAVAAGLSPFYLWYAQEARMYTLTVLESVLLMLALWPLLRRHPTPKPAHYLTFGLAAVALVYTHYPGAFLVGFALIAYLAVRIDARTLWRLLAILCLLALLAIPLYPHIWQLLTGTGFVAFSRRPLSALLDSALSTFSLGSAEPWYEAGWRKGPFVLLVLVGVVAMLYRKKWRALLLSLGGFTIPLALFFVASWIEPNYSNPRHLTILSPFWFLLLGNGLAAARRLFWPAAVALGIVVAVIGGSVLLRTVTDPPMIRDDVRAVAEYIKARARPGDAILWHDAIMMTTYDYYSIGLPYTALPHYGQLNEEATLAALDRWVADHPRIWFIREPAPFFFDTSIVPEWLKEHLMRIDSTSFRASWTQLQVELYQTADYLAAVPADAIPVALNDKAWSIHAIRPDTELVAGRGAWLSLFWSLKGPADTPAPSVCVRLSDSEGVWWADGCALLAPLPSEEPITSPIISQQLYLSLPSGLPPTAYDLHVIIGEQVAPAGELEVRGGPEDEPLVPEARFSNGLALIDAIWTADEFQAGLWAIGDLLWQLESPIDDEIEVTIRLTDHWRRTLAQRTIPLGSPDYPAEIWQAGELVRRRVALQLPFDLDGRYPIRLSVRMSDGDEIPLTGLLPNPWVDLGSIHVNDWPAVYELPQDVQHRLDRVRFGEQIELLAYDIDRTDEGITVVLYWQSQNEPSGDYGVFVHVGKPGEPPVAQQSGAPANWARPTGSWRPGEIIIDSHLIPWTSELQTGQMSILVGIYELEHPDHRLKLTVAGEGVDGDAFDLGQSP